MGKSQMTLFDLKTFAKRQARLSFANYGEHESYRQDRNRILRAKRAAIKAADLYWSSALEGELLVIGDYFGGRLQITKQGIEYTAGQYAPTEIYYALTDYFEQIRRKGVSYE